MRRDWEPEELIDCWTLVDDDWALVANKSWSTRLGFAVLLKFFELEGRFPCHAGEVPKPALGYLAGQLKVPSEAFGDYAWTGRTIEYHRAQIRKALGFREATVGDEERLAGWLAAEVCPLELSEERRREALVARCRAQRIEPPAATRIERILGSAQEAFDQHFTARTVNRLSVESIARLEELVADGGEDDGPGMLAELKADPGRLGLETLLRELDKLERVRAVGLPPTCSARCPTGSLPPGRPALRAATPPTCGTPRRGCA